MELGAVRSDLRDAHSQLSLYREQRDAANTRVEALSTELDHMRERLQNTEAGLEKARNTIAEMVVFEAESKQLKDELDIRDHRLTDLEQALVHSESRSEQATSHLTSLQATLSSVRAELERERLDAEQFVESLRAAEERVASLDAIASRVPELEALLASTRFEREAAEARLTQLDVDLRQTQEELARTSDLESEVERLGSELSERTASIAELQASLADATLIRAELTTSRARMVEMQAELDERITETDRLGDELASATERLTLRSQGMEDHDIWHHQLQNARARINLLLGQLGDRTIVAHRARADLTLAQHRLAELEQQLNESTTIVLDENELEQDRTTLMAELETAREHIEKLESELAETDDARLDLAAARDRIAELEGLLHRTASGGQSGQHQRTAPVPEDSHHAEMAISLGAGHHRDDLRVVTGIGTRIEEILHDRGFTRWEDLADLDESACDELAQEIEVPAPVDPESWSRQARLLIARYPDPTSRPDRQMYRKNTSRQDRVSGAK